MSVVDDATLQMSFVDVYVVDDAIRYRCLGRRQLHTHTQLHKLWKYLYVGMQRKTLTGRILNTLGGLCG